MVTWTPFTCKVWLLERIMGRCWLKVPNILTRKLYDCDLSNHVIFSFWECRKRWIETFQLTTSWNCCLFVTNNTPDGGYRGSCFVFASRAWFHEICKASYRKSVPLWLVTIDLFLWHSYVTKKPQVGHRKPWIWYKPNVDDGQCMYSPYITVNHRCIRGIRCWDIGTLQKLEPWKTNSVKSK